MQELTAGEPVIIGGVTVVAVARVCVHGQGERSAYWIHATKEPVAVLVCDGDEARGFDMQGHRVSVDALCAATPSLTRYASVDSVSCPSS